MITMNDLNEGEKREQIPSESGPEGRTGKIISEQNANRRTKERSKCRKLF